MVLRQVNTTTEYIGIPTPVIYREQTAADFLADEIRKDIDFSILRDLLVKQGWFSVKASRKYSGTEIEEWARIQCIGKFHYLSEQWLFSNEKDAIIFILKWTK